MSLPESPEPLTRRQGALVVAITIAAALTRFAALARTPWDWDEFLFLLALRDYDVAAHHPHPPGFPLFVGLARVLQLVTGDGFRALQAVTMAGAIALLPVTFAFCRGVRLGFRDALASATIFAFLPNVWFYGGTALSDVPAATLTIAAAALLLRGARSAPSLLAGAAMLALAAGIRPQALLIGIAPAAVGAWHQRRRIALLAAAAAIATAIVGGSYFAAASLTGVERYREAVRAHSAYITATDTIFSPTRRAAGRLLDDFFVRPFQQPLLNVVVTVLAATGGAVALLRRERPALLAVATFAPFALFAWMFLDHFSASRFSIGYIALFAILASRGAAVLARDDDRAVFAIVAACVLISAVWIRPALREVREEISPPVAMAEWIRGRAPSGTKIYADRKVAAMADFLLSDFPREVVTSMPREARGLYVTEGEIRDAKIFRRGRVPLWDLVRRRYFEISVVVM